MCPVQTVTHVSGRSIDFPSLEFLVSVLVAGVRGCERKRRTYCHLNLSQKSLFMLLLD